MNEQEIIDYLKTTKFQLVRITRFQSHDRIKVQDSECTLTWTMRKHIEEYPINEFKKMVKPHE